MRRGPRPARQAGPPVVHLVTSYGPGADAVAESQMDVGATNMDCTHAERQVVGNGIYCQVCGQLVEDLSPPSPTEDAATATDNNAAGEPPDVDDKTE